MLRPQPSLWPWRGDHRHRAVVAAWFQRPSRSERRSRRQCRQNRTSHCTARGTSPGMLHTQPTQTTY